MTTNPASGPTSSIYESSQRLTHQATFPDYNEAKRLVNIAREKNDFVWIEAQVLKSDTKVWPARPEGIAYAVHVSADAKEVPKFAIEVHSHGRLENYEVDRQKINYYANINENDKIKLIRAQDASLIIENPPKNQKRAIPS